MDGRKSSARPVTTLPNSNTVVHDDGFRSIGLCGTLGSETSDALTAFAERIDRIPGNLCLSIHLFGSLIFYKATVLHSDGIAFASFGIAIVKALVLGKFILVLHALKIGERMGSARVLLADILKRSVLFVVFLIALTVVEEIIVGYFHGRISQEVLSEMAGGTLPQAFAVSMLMLLILIPYFTFRGVADRLGEGALWKLLTERARSR